MRSTQWDTAIVHTSWMYRQSQPLDIAAFHPCKTHLKRKYQHLRAGSCKGLIDPLAWIFELMQCPKDFLEPKVGNALLNLSWGEAA